MKTIFLVLAGVAIIACWIVGRNLPEKKLPVSEMLSYTVNPESQTLKFYWRNDSLQPFRSIGNLKNYLARHGSKLTFATNGGMFRADNSPVGLYIEARAGLAPLDTAPGRGNFYLKHNGIFYLTANRQAVICRTEEFNQATNIAYATQSGPMLLTDGNIHPAFKKGSTNLNIRNGVGMLPGNKVLFAMSKNPVNFYDFAAWFKKNGCRNALYLDGFVSRTYLPAQNWRQTDGNFGVIIGVTEK